VPGTQAQSPEDRVQRALELAYRQLNRRERTTAEMRGYLEGHEVDGSTVEAALELLVQERYLDDARYAQLFASDKRELEQWGGDRIRRTLLERGIGRELVEDVVSAAEPESELERALEILRRRFPEPPRERRDRDRALGVLIRKGYDSELALDALSAYARDPGEPSVR
jgi:regulatory protein